MLYFHIAGEAYTDREIFCITGKRRDPVISPCYYTSSLHTGNNIFIVPFCLQYKQAFVDTADLKGKHYKVRFISFSIYNLYLHAL